jgi:RNA polymerase sigma-70 factor (ECF subfamily)
MGGIALARPLSAESPSVSLPSDFDTQFDFEKWMRAEQRRVFLLCLRITRDTDEADMAAQDSFLKAHRYFSSASGTQVPVEDLGKWITRVAVNTCLDRLRSRSWKFWQRRPSHETEQNALAIASTGEPSPEDRVRAVEISRRLSAALQRLSPRQRAIFVLKHYEDRKLEEISQILGLEVGTVKAHMARAVARLRVELADLYRTGEA